MQLRNIPHLHRFSFLIFLLALLFLGQPSAIGQTIIWQDSVVCGGTNKILWTHPTCPGDNDGIVSIRVDTSQFTFPFEITILSGVTALPQFNGLQINTSGVDTFFNVPAIANNMLTEDANGNALPCPFLANFVNDPSQINPVAAFSNQIACFGLTVDSIVGTPTNGDAPFTVLWRPGANTGFSPVLSANGNAILNVPADDYTLTMVDANGCTDSSIISVTQPDTLIASFTQTNILCRNENNGSINVSAIGGTPFTVGNRFNYSWSPPLPNDSNLQNLSPQVYSVTITDSLGCQDSILSINITQPSAVLDASIIAQNNVSCKGGNDGKIVTTIVGGTSFGGLNPYQINWTPNVSSVDSALNLTVGAYKMIAIDANGCQDSVNAVITEPTDSLRVTLLAKKDLPCRNQPIGEASWSITGGTAPYNLEWSHDTAATSTALTNLLAGTYTVTATDANGCIAVNSVTLTQPATSVQISVIAQGNVFTCFGDTSGFATVQITNGVAPYVVTWPYGNVTNVALAGGTSTDSLRGGFGQIISVEDDSGCVATVPVNITEPAPIALSFDSTATQCIGDSAGGVRVFASGGPSPGFYFYQWNDFNSSTTAIVNGLPSGTYSVTVSDTTGNCLPSIGSVTVNQPASPLIIDTVFTTKASCASVADASAQVVISGGTPPYSAVTWSAGLPPAIGVNLSRINLPLGINFATVSDASGCRDSIVFNITEPQQIEASIDTLQEVNCFNGADGQLEISAINGTPPYRFSWQKLSSALIGTEVYNFDSTIFNGLGAGTYVGRVVDVNGCFHTDTATLINPTPITISFQNTSVVSCFGGNDGTTEAVAAGGRSTPFYNYSWENGQNNAIATGLNASTWTVTVTNALGLCAVSDSITLTQNTEINASFVADSLPDCDSANGGLSISNITGGIPFAGNTYQINWIGLGNSTLSATGLAQGIYQVEFTDALGCSVIESTILNNLNAPQVVNQNITNPTCFGSNDGAIDLTTSGASTLTFTWNTGANTEDITNLDSGVYVLNIEDTLGCLRTEQFVLVDPNELAINFIRNNISCTGLSDGSVTALVSGGIGPFSYQWSNGVTGTANAVNGLSAGMIVVTVTDNGAAVSCTRIDSIAILDPNPIAINLLDSSNNLCAGGTNARFRFWVSGGTGTPSVAIFPPPFSQFPTFDTINVATTAANYSIIATDINGCTASETVNLVDPIALQFSGSPITTVANCPGDASGSIQINVTGGTGNLTYAWLPNVGATPTLQNVVDGQYGVTVTDQNGCQITNTVNVGSLPPVQITIDSLFNVSCFGNADGEVYISITGGSNVYPSITYTPTATALFPGTVAVNLNVGTYNIAVQDDNGCTASRNFSITQPTAPLTANLVSSIGPACDGDSVGSSSTIAIAGGTLPYTSFWSGGDAVSTTQRINIPAGPYSVNIVDSNGCIAQVLDTLPTSNPLVFSIDSIKPSCLANNGSLWIDTIFGSGGIPYQIQWLDFELNQIGNTDSLGGIGAGLYYLVITANNCSPDTTPIILNNLTPTIISVQSIVNPSCAGDSNGSIEVIVTPSPPLFEYWTALNGSILDTIGNSNAINNLTAGDYFYNVIDFNGCLSTRSFQLVEPQPLSIAFNTTDISCFGLNDGSSAALVSGGNLPYQTQNWFENGVLLSSSNALSGLDAGTYVFNVVDNLGCSNTDSIAITNPALLELLTTSTNQITCNGDQNGSFAVEANGGRMPYNFSFPSPAGSQIFITDSTVGYTFLNGGNYQISVVDFSGCTDTIAINITEPPALVVSIVNIDSTTCFGDSNGSISLQTSGGTPGYQYLWNSGNPIPPITSSTNAGLLAGPTNVTVQDLAGCQQIVNFTIPQVVSPLGVTATVAGNVSCPGGSDGTVNATANGGAGGYQFQWTNLTTGLVEANTQSHSSASASPYEIIVTDNLGCEVRDTVNVTEPTSFSFSVSLDTLADCGDSNGVATVTLNGGTPFGSAPAYQIAWLNNQFASIGQNGFTANGLAASTYFVEVTDGIGCIDTVGPVIMNNIGGPTVSVINSQDPTCFGFADGQIEIGISGNGPFTIDWLGQNDFDAILEAVAQGIYLVAVTDVDTCTTIISDTLVSPTPLVFSNIGVTNNTCFGGNNGQISLGITGGTGSFSYQWNTGFTGANNTNLTAGVYAVTVSESANLACQLDTTITVAEPTAVSLAVIQNNNANCGANNGLAQVQAAQGNGGPYAYTWLNSNGVVIGSTPTLNGLGVGTYYAVASDISGCVSDTLAVSISENGAPQLSITATANVRCFGEANGAISVAAVGSNLNYNWSNGANTPNITGLVAGNYSLTVTDANSGCSSVIAQSITEPAVLSASSIAQNVVCNGDASGSIQITTSGGTAPFNYVWSNSSIGNTALASNLTAGTYTVTVVDNNSCTATTTTTISEPQAISANFSTNSPNCGATDGSILLLGLSGGTGNASGFTYDWYNSNFNLLGTSPLSLLNNLEAGAYYLEVTDALSCTDTLLIGLSNIGAPSLSMDSIIAPSCNQNCDGGLVLDTTNIQNLTFLWSNGQTTPFILNACPGIYFVEITDISGSPNCVSVLIDTVPLGNAIVSNISVLASPICQGDANGEAQVSVLSPTGTFSYLWSSGEFGSLAQQLQSGINTVTISNLSGSCSIVDTVDIPTPPIISLGSVNLTSPSCGIANGSIQVQANGGYGLLNYNWSTGANGTAVNNIQAGTYNLTVTDDSACAANFVINLSNQGNGISITKSRQSTSCPTSCDGSAAVSLITGSIPYTVRWFNNSTQQFIALGDTANGLCAGIYEVEVLSGGCIYRDTIMIEGAQPIQIFTSTTDASCGNADGSIVANAIGGAGSYTYQWLNSNFALILPQPTGNVANNLASGNYFVRVIDGNGCDFTTQVLLNDSGAPVVNLVNLTQPSCDGVANGSIDIEVITQNSNLTYNWQPTAATTQDIAGLLAGTYVVQVTDGSNCQASRSFTLTNQYQLTASRQIISSPTCPGVANGAATFTNFIGSSPFVLVWNGNIIADTALQLVEGQNTVIITDNEGCTFTDTFNLNQALPITLDSVNIVNSSCGFNTGAITAFVTGGNSNYNFSWNGVAGSNALTNAGAGLYSLIVDDGNGCSSEFLIPLSDSSSTAPVINTSSIPSSCFGSCDGEVSVSVQGTGLYSVSWPSIPSSDTSISNLCSGIYGVLIFEQGSGCTYADTVSIIEPAGIQVSSSAQLPNCSQADGAISLSISGGQAPYNVLWMDEDSIPLIPVVTGSTLSNVAAGIYVANVSDASGCSQFIRITLNNLGGPSILLDSAVNAACSGICSGGIFISSTGATPLSFAWNDGSLTEDLTQICAGTYSLTVEDALGCESFASYTISNNLLFNAIASQVKQPICFNSADASASVTLVGGQAPYSYLWSSGEQTDTAIALTAGVQSVTVTDIAGCNITANVNILAPAPIVLSTLLANLPNCNSCNGSIAFIAQGGTGTLSYTWDNGATTNSEINLCGGAYTILVADSFGCSRSFIIPLSTTQAPTATVLSTPTSCNNGCDGSAFVNSVSSSPHQTFWPLSNLTSDSISGLCAGTYAYEITDSAGCVLADTVVISEPTAIQTVFNYELSNCNSANGKIFSQTNGGNSPYSYNWFDDNGAALGITTDSLVNASGGFYQLEVTDNNGCSSIFVAALNDSSNMVIFLENLENTTCRGVCDGIIDIGVLGNGPFTFNWSNNETTEDITALCDDSYFVEVTDINGCVALAQYDIFAPQVVNAFVSRITNATCENSNNGSLNATIQGVGPFTYFWSDTSGYASADEVAENLLAGTYFLEVTSPRGCISRDTATVNFDVSLSLASFGDTTVCEPLDFRRIGTIVSGTYPSVSLSWIDNLGNTLSNTPNATAIPVAGNNDYFVTAISLNCIARDTVTIIVNAFDSVEAGRNKTIVPGAEVVLGGNPTSSSSLIYTWSPAAGLNDTNIANPIAQPDSTTTYLVRATNTAGCTLVDSVTITLLDDLNIINGFSPNGDGVNDFWILDFMLDYPQAKIEVYSRWGQLVYEGVGYANPWDGTSDGTPVAVGTYYYIIQLNDNTLEVEEITGSVTIIR